MELNSVMGLDTVGAGSAAEGIQEVVSEIVGMDTPNRWRFLLEGLKRLAPKLLTIVLILLIGTLLIRMVIRVSRRLLEKSKLEVTLHSFILSIFKICLYTLLGILALTILIPDAIGWVVALMSVFGLAVSLAIQESLSNLAGGISVLFTKPFSIGDYVDIGGREGTVQDIRLNYTVIKTVDNKVVHVPNGDVAKAQITNFTSEPMRRLDLDFSIGYEDDFALAQKLVTEMIAQHPQAYADPEPIVRMVGHGESAVVLGCRVWCATPDYWNLKFDLLEQVKEQFDRNGISIPFNRLYTRSHA